MFTVIARNAAGFHPDCTRHPGPAWKVPSEEVRMDPEGGKASLRMPYASFVESWEIRQLGSFATAMRKTSMIAGH